jgi:hypothetical protein
MPTPVPSRSELAIQGRRRREAAVVRIVEATRASLSIPRSVPVPVVLERLADRLEHDPLAS